MKLFTGSRLPEDRINERAFLAVVVASIWFGAFVLWPSDGSEMTLLYAGGSIALVLLGLGLTIWAVLELRHPGPK